ncbi:MAG: phosphate ABC transporter substrate-binding protein PstS [Ilumatobacteraceae bacterium]
MNKRTTRLAIGGLLAMTLLAAACGSDSKDEATTTAAAATTAGEATTAGAATTTEGKATTTAGNATTTAGGGSESTTAPDKVEGTLQGSGSTFQLAFQQEAIDAFQKANKGVTITYGGGGSGKGRTDLKDGTVDFAGSDSAFPDADKPADQVLYFPILLGPITVSYNLDGVEDLQLSPDTIAKIFQRQITKWDDAAIAADNPGVTLPSTDISVAHRSDGSGTTQNFTTWLQKAAPSTWTLAPGSTVEWPADTLAGNGNAGVAQIIKDTKGAIGYIDLSDAVASGLSFAKVENQSGEFVEPTAEAASAAGDGVEVPDDLVFSALNSTAAEAYPITYQSWVIVFAKQKDAAHAALVKAYLKYLLTDGQDLLGDLDYAPLPASIQTKAVAQLDQITS